MEVHGWRLNVWQKIRISGILAGHTLQSGDRTRQTNLAGKHEEMIVGKAATCRERIRASSHWMDKISANFVVCHKLV